ncbi:MAG: leucyl aminopeptidase [Pseudomonadota bacterium]
MKYFATSGTPEKQRTACLIVGVFEAGKLSAAAARVDEAGKGFISSLVKNGDFSGGLGSTLVVHDPKGVTASRVLLVGCGNKTAFSADSLRKAQGAAAAAVMATGAADALSCLGNGDLDDLDGYDLARAAVAEVEHRLYRFDQFKSGKKRPRPKLRRFGFACESRKASNRADKGAEHAAGIAKGVALSRELGDLPANVCTPTYLASTAREIASGDKSMQVKILSEPEIRKLGMGSFLSVTAGSHSPAKLIVLQYKGGKAKDAPYALVGKGITFDTGGISIKPAGAMDEMKYDMCGAASVLGTMRAVQALKLPINVVAVVPTCENMPGGSATKPGDIVKSMSGQTIEVLNTDAEGRLILCDALTYTKRFKPQAIIDVATLTGACVIALGAHYSAVMSNDDSLAGELVEAGNSANDRTWHLPIGDLYFEQLKSNFADMANVGGRPAGALTAGTFLSRFAQGQRWAHLDIAGVAWLSGSKKGATGRPVGLLTQYLINRS